jgi:tape measure domain-containing protein
VDPQVQAMGVQLTTLAVRNTAGAIGDKRKALKAAKDDQRTIAELDEIINGLISERTEIIRIAQAFEQELVSQQISDEDISYVTEHLVPIVEHLAKSAGNKQGAVGELAKSGGSEGSADTEQMLERLKPLLSAQTVKILQLIGFNFKRALGEPLTELIAKLIASKAPMVGDSKEKQELQVAELNTAYFKVMLDQDAFGRWQSVQQSTSTG